MAREIRRIFLSSPSDVQPERDRVHALVQRLNAEMAELELEVIRWEDSFYTASATFQDQIPRPDECDLVVCLFWGRLGTPLPAPFNREDGSSRSGSEYEFELAIDAAQRDPGAGPDILVYRKTAPLDLDSSREARAENRALDAFWRRWFRDEEGHFLAAFDTFETIDGFAWRFERHLKRWLESRRRVEWDVALHGSPFRGLQAFQEEYSPVFFGRRREVERARARLMTSAEQGAGSLFLIGASGSGKSSLLRAGLIPRLLIPDSTAPLVDRWSRLVSTPGELGADPAGGLARALQSEQVLPGLSGLCRAEELAAWLRREPEQALARVAEALDHWAAAIARREGHDRLPKTGLIIAIDQFEEVFRLDQSAFQSLMRFLIHAQSHPRVWLVFTLRSDFYPRLLGETALSTLKDRSRVVDVTPPAPADVREMIAGAAQAAGLVLEDDGRRSLLELLERDASEAGALPMLQFVLQALFEARDREKGLLCLAEYDRLGGAAGALATEAERVLSTLSGSMEQSLSRVLRQLVALSVDSGDELPHARSVDIDIFSSESRERELVDALLQARLLMTWSDGEGQRQVRVAHESLFRDWPRAARQIARDRRDLETRARLEQSRQLWAAAPEDERRQRLLHGLALAEARDLRHRWGRDLPDGLRRFIQESESAQRSRRRRRQALAAAAMASLGALSIAATWFAVNANQARHAAEQAQSQAERITDLQQDLLGDMEPRAIAGGLVAGLRDAARQSQDGERLSAAFDELAAHANTVDITRGLLIERILNPAEARMDEELADDPVAHGQLRMALADIYRRWGDFSKSRDLADQGGKQLAIRLDESDRRRLNADITRARIMAQQGEYQSAVDLMESAWQRSREAEGPLSDTALDAEYQLANIYRLTGDIDQALELAESVVTRFEQRHGNQAPHTLRARNLLAAVLEDHGRLDAAQTLQEQVLDTSREVLGEDAPDTITARQNLAGQLYRQEDYQAALDMQERVVAAHTRVQGESHPDALSARFNYGLLLRDMGQLEEAHNIQSQVYEAERRLLGADHPNTLISMSILGDLKRKLGELEPAGNLLGEATDRAAEVFGERHWRTLSSALDLVRVLKESGEMDRAQDRYEAQLAWLEARDPDELSAREMEIRAELQLIEWTSSGPRGGEIDGG